MEPDHYHNPKNATPTDGAPLFYYLVLSNGLTVLTRGKSPSFILKGALSFSEIFWAFFVVKVDKGGTWYG